jgi:hypothetical protein
MKLNHPNEDLAIGFKVPTIKEGGRLGRGLGRVFQTAQRTSAPVAGGAVAYFEDHDVSGADLSPGSTREIGRAGLQPTSNQAHAGWQAVQPPYLLPQRYS